MTRSSFVIVNALTIACFFLPAPANALDPVATFFRDKLVDKLVDEVFDSVTGRPNIGLLEQRLSELEYNAVTKGEMREEIRKLRAGINDRLTRREFRAMVERASAEIAAIKSRLDELEERIEKLEVENQDLKENTTKAKDPRYFQMRGSQFADEGKFTRAIANYSIALRLDPNSIDAYLGRSETYMRLSAPGVAAVDATEAIRLNPRAVTGYLTRGLAYEQMGENGRVIADATEVIRLSAEAPRLGGIVLGRGIAPVEICQAYMLRGHAYLSAKAYDKAIADLSEALRLNSLDAVAFNNRAAAYVGKNDYDKAIADYDKATVLGPKIWYHYEGRGNAHLQKAAYAEAIADFTEAIRLEPTYALSYYGRGIAYGSQGRPGYTDAIANFTEAIRLDPTDSRFYFERGVYYSHLKEDDRAIADFTEAIRLEPTYAPSYHNRAVLYFRKADTARARADLDEAKRLGR